MASVLIDFPESCSREWDQACSQGTLGKLVVSADGVSINKGGLFYFDVDKRRGESQEEIEVNLSQLLPPFICVSVLFAVSDSYEGSSIGPHMDDILELSFSRQLAEWCKKKPTLQQLFLPPQIPISLCLDEPDLSGSTFNRFE